MNDNELRELDAWIAEHVMKSKPIIQARALNKDETGMALLEDDFVTRGIVKEFCDSHKEYHYKECEVFPHYTTDPADAMQVLEKCCQNYGMCGIVRVAYSKGFVEPWVCEHEKSETLPLAICLFARKLFSK